MPDTETLPANTADTVADWRADMEVMTEESGYYHRLGKAHSVLFLDEGTTLLVTFETMADIMAHPEREPLGMGFARAHGWSLLCVIAEAETWFRDPAVYGFFDHQVDDAFFEDFDRVMFYGAGMGGYAACAFSVASPGARVLALNPRATLDPEQARWDLRNKRAARLDFTSRYGYAPDMLQGCERAYVIHDPEVNVEAMQAALFRAPYITRLSARHLGDHLEGHFAQMGFLTTLVDQVMAGSLTKLRYAKLWRQRRDYLPYLKLLLAVTATGAHPDRERKICNSVTARLRAPRFARHLARLNEAAQQEAAQKAGTKAEQP
ncbi:MAG: phosphoadenosine phosphosulfate reductase [Cypionkella sp.]